MRSGEAGEGSELAEFGARWPPPYNQGYGWTRSATPQHPPAHHLARHSRSHQWLQDNRHTSYEAEDARGRARGGVYYSPPGTSYTIVERPASSHGHHTSYSHHYAGKLSRAPYLGSTTIANSAAGATSLRNSTNHLSAANGKKRPISPEQVLRLFGQGGAAALGKALPPSHPPAPLPAPLPARRHSPASSPSSTTHHAIYRGGERERPYSSGGAPPPPAEPATRTVTMSRDPADSHGFGICVKGGKEAGVGVYISRVEEGSVAERAGLRPGDSILQVNGTPFSGISHEDALKMLKSCRQLTMTVRTAGALVGRASCSWMDRYGRPASPPPLRPPRSSSKDRSVDLCIEPGQSLGLMIRGGLEYNLGIYITGVDKDSVADRAGLMVGDQILEVNNQSFIDVTHDEAVAQLKYHKRMSLVVRDVGKVPHACTAYGEREAAPRISGWGKRRGAAATAVEQKARSLLPQCDLPAIAYYMEEYASRRLTPDSFLTVVRDLLDTPQKYTLLTEIREFMLPEDRARFDELVYRRGEEPVDHHIKRGPERHMLPSSTMHELHDPEGPAEAPLVADHRSPSEDSGLGLPPHDHAYRSGRAWRPSDAPPPDDDLEPPHEEYEEEGRRSRRHSSPCNSREGSTTALHTQHYDDSCGYLEGLRSSLGGWTQKVKSWYWGRPLELAHNLSRSFDMKEDSGALLEERGGIRRHQSMQRLQHGDLPDEARAARVVPDHHGNLHITVKKTKPILGIAIEGGANTKHPLPRIINIHEHGAAYEAGGLEVGQLILAVDGHRVEGLQHQDVARLIAESFAQRDKPEIEFLVVEAKKSNLEPKPTALIFLEA
ncbi:whirlin isoform X5 [Spodoptera frugiperda]|uniref:Whirlin isoform X5 n=1 Tax=Spodoptera frugiperda TaxID=7108 RepID=A0A9R0F7N9_SPOFR|nr:whirlin isoform X5 [Spodoptera frugiperda]